MDWKKVAKKSSILNWINSNLKNYKLKLDLRNMSHYYKKKAAKLNFSYDANMAISEFKCWHKANAPDYVPLTEGALRVFWIGSNKDQDESGFLQALQRLANVTVFHDFEGEYGTWSGEGSGFESPYFEKVREINDGLLFEQLARGKDQGSFDLLIGQMWAHRISKEALSLVQKMGIPVINISMDDRLPINWGSKGDVRLGSVGLVSGTNLVLTTSSETCLWYGVEGCPALFWPLASSPEIFSPDEHNVRDIDVLFIGNKYGTRGKIVKYLEGNGVKVDCFGAGWPNGHINAEQMASLSKRAEIILGVGTIGHCDDLYTLKLRDFDAPMSGALYLTHRNPDLCKLFIEGEEIECYSSLKEALVKIQYYLNNPEKMRLVAEKGFSRACKQHTWDKRLNETFSMLGLVNQFPIKEKVSKVENWLE